MFWDQTAETKASKVGVPWLLIYNYFDVLRNDLELQERKIIISSSSNIFTW